MSTLREAFRNATATIQERITADAVKRLQKTTEEVAVELKDSYSDFFQVLHRSVLNDPAMNAADSGTPAIFQGAGIPMRPWHAVTPRWFIQKEKAAKQGGFRSLNFYHGVTDSLVVSRRTRKGRFKKKRSNLSFDQFIQSLAMGGEEVTQGFFGPMKIAYSLVRPDKGEVKITQLNDAIVQIRQRRLTGQGNKSVFAGPLDNTIIRTTITAFPRIEGMLDEKRLVDYMARISGHPEQWQKVTGTGRSNWRIRPIILPLVNWYMKANFRLLLEERFK